MKTLSQLNEQDFNHFNLLKQLPNDIKHQMRCVLKGITYDTWLSSDILPVYKEASNSFSEDVLLKALK
jgi:hypothetical protein